MVVLVENILVCRKYTPKYLGYGHHVSSLLLNASGKKYLYFFHQVSLGISVVSSDSVFCRTAGLRDGRKPKRPDSLAPCLKGFLVHFAEETVETKQAV